MAVMGGRLFKVSIYDGVSDEDLLDPQAGNATYKYTKDDVDTTAFGQADHSHYRTLGCFEASFEGNFNYADTDGWMKLLTANDFGELISGSNVMNAPAAKMRFYIDATHGYECDGHIEIELSAEPTGVVTASATFVSSGTVTKLGTIS